MFISEDNLHLISRFCEVVSDHDFYDGIRGSIKIHWVVCY